MLVEVFFHLSGNMHLLLKAFGLGPTESIISYYREYHNRFAYRLGLNLGALNSLILGNQIASQLNLYAMLWFFPFYYFIKLPEIFKQSNLWFLIAFILFILSPTMTANILFIISFFLLVFYIPISRINNLKWKIIFSVISILISGVLIKLLFPIFFDAELLNQLGSMWYALDFYVYGFSYPIFYFLDMSFYDQLFGQVKQGWAELGYFKLLISAGALWVFLMTIALFGIIISAFRLLKSLNIKNKINSNNIIQQRKWIWIAQVNAFICFMYFLSLIHYITIFRLGAIQLFSLHIAITMYATRKAKMLQNNTTDVNINIHKILPI
jgi:hypothetical protein